MRKSGILQILTFALFTAILTACASPTIQATRFLPQVRLSLPSFQPHHQLPDLFPGIEYARIVSMDGELSGYVAAVDEGGALVALIDTNNQPADIQDGYFIIEEKKFKWDIGAEQFEEVAARNDDEILAELQKQLPDGDCGK